MERAMSSSRITATNRVVEVQRVAVNFGNVNVCPSGQTTPAPCSQTLTLNYNVAATTTFGSTQVLTQVRPTSTSRWAAAAPAPAA